MRRAVTVWPPSAEMAALETVARESGGLGALRWARTHFPDVKVAYLHGGRHDLFWEFRLVDSLRWQAHLNGLAPALFQARSRHLVKELGLLPVLNRTVEELRPSQRARADLAAALLPEPDLLIWEEPFALLTSAERVRVSSVIRQHCCAKGLMVLALATEEAELGSLVHLRPLPATR